MCRRLDGRGGGKMKELGRRKLPGSVIECAI